MAVGRFTLPFTVINLGVFGAGLALADMPPPRLVDAAGARFPFVESGAGEPILFVHGAVGDYRKWDGLWRDVADGHRFMAYTQRWFGEADWPADKPYSREVHAADLAAILRKIGEPVHLVGLSNGGPPALLAAMETPRFVRTLILYEPNLPEILSGDVEGEAAVEAFFEGFAKVSDAVEADDSVEAARALVEAIYAMPEGGFDGLDAVQKVMVLDNAHTVSLLWNSPEPASIDCGMLATITAPTLVISGGDTLLAWRMEAEAIANCVPDGKWTEIPGVGHNGPVEAKDKFVQLTLGFVDEHASK